MHLTDSGVAAYPEYTQESTGGGSYDGFPAINDTRGQQTPNPTLRLGQIIFDKRGYAYQYVRTTGAAVQGDMAKMASNATGTVSAADSTSDNIHSVVTNITGITSAGQEKGNWLFFPASGLATVRRQIKGNTATASSVTRFDISVKDQRVGRGGYDADALAAALSTSTVVNLFRNHYVTVTGAATEIPVGVFRHSCAANDYTLIGIHGVFLCKGNAASDAITDGGIVCLSTSGTVKGPTTAGLTATDVQGTVGVAKLALATGTGLIPVQLTNLFGRW